MKKDSLIIFDTTLRDGEQSAGAGLTVDEKLIIEPVLLFLANSLHTLNRDTTLIFMYLVNESKEKLYRSFCFLSFVI